MVRLHLLGNPSLEADGADIDLASLSRKARLLLAVLAIERRVHGRSELAGRLWPDVREDSARVSLRTALSQLRARLGPAAPTVLHGQRDGGIALAEAVSTDLDEVDRLLADGNAEAALERCAGELLPGLDDDWVLERRDELRDRLARGLDLAAASAEADGDLDLAVQLSRRLIVLDPMAEHFARELIRRLASAGDRGAALSAYERLRDRLADELHIVPSAATRELAQEVRHEYVASPPSPEPPPVVPPVAHRRCFGREAELEDLGREWTRARQGELRIAVLSGEPGIGKTRLAAELYATARASGATVLLGRCYEDGLVPYEPLAEAMGGYVAECPAQTLWDQIGVHASALAAIVPAVSERLGVRPTASEQFGAAQLVQAIVALVRAVAAVRPTILLLEDLHWAEDSTAIALRHLGRGAPATLLVLCTLRDTEVGEEHPITGALAEARRARVLSELPLTGLDEEAVASIVSAESGAHASPRFVSAVYARTEGNPFFVEELVRDAEHPRTADDAIVLPQSVKDLILRRLRGMDTPDLLTLETAAVIGQQFDLATLAAASGRPQAEVITGLDRASKRSLILPASVPGAYAFAHALMRETVYQRMSPIRRAHLHGEVGLALEGLPFKDDGARAAALAHHFSAAGEHGRAVAHHAAAVRAAARIGALRAGLEHCDAAMESVQLCGGLSEGLRVTVALERGRLLHRSGREREAVASLEQALAGAREAGSEDVELEILTELGHAGRNIDVPRALAVLEAALSLAHRREDVPAQVRALSRGVFVYSDALRLDRASEDGERALALAVGTGDERITAEALDALKLVAWQLGDVERLSALTTQLERIQRRLGELWTLCWTLLEAAQGPIAGLQWADARARLTAALELADQANGVGASGMLHDSLATVHEAEGEPEAALAACARSIDFLEYGGFVSFIGWTEATAGLVLLRLRAAERAAEHLEHGLATAEQAGSRHEILRCSALLARARWLAGDHAGALALAERAEALCLAITAPPGCALLYVAPAMAAAADVLTDAGRPERAEILVAGPLEVASRPDRAWYAVPLSIASARCLVAQNRIEAAHRALAPALQAWRSQTFAPGWEALVVLAAIHAAAGRSDEADETADAARSAVDALARSISDEALRSGLRRAAERELTRVR